MVEQKVMPGGFAWVPREQRISRLGGPVAPRKADTSTPLLWLKRQHDELFLVNASGERLDEVTSEAGGLLTVDDAWVASHGAALTYRDVDDGAAVKVDEYDGFFDLDWVHSLGLRIQSPRLGRIGLGCPLEKGGYQEVVLLWATGELGPGVSCTRYS